jgi:hypothetical protein
MPVCISKKAMTIHPQFNSIIISNASSPTNRMLRKFRMIRILRLGVLGILMNLTFLTLIQPVIPQKFQIFFEYPYPLKKPRSIRLNDLRFSTKPNPFLSPEANL